MGVASASGGVEAHSELLFAASKGGDTGVCHRQSLDACRGQIDLQKNDAVESVLIRLTGAGKCSRRALHQFLKSRGFKSDEDIYYLPAIGVAPWQSPAIIMLSVFSDEAAAYETEDDIVEGDSEWDRLDLEYPICALATGFIAKFVTECDAICSRFGLKALIEGQSKSASEIEAHLNSIAESTTRQFFEPGSEELALLVEARYGR